MSTQITVNFATYDPSNDEFALYFVEDAPWPDTADGWGERLRGIQHKVLDAIDAAVDGGVAKVFPESVRKKFRVQVDSPGGSPDSLETLVEKINDYIRTNAEYSESIRSSQFVAGIRVVTGKAMGRFKDRLSAAPVPPEN